MNSGFSETGKTLHSWRAKFHICISCIVYSCCCVRFHILHSEISQRVLQINRGDVLFVHAHEDAAAHVLCFCLTILFHHWKALKCSTKNRPHVTREEMRRTQKNTGFKCGMLTSSFIPFIDPDVNCIQTGKGRQRHDVRVGVERGEWACSR